MSGSYKTKPSDWLRIVLQDEGKIPKPRAPKPQPRKRMLLDRLCELEEERSRKDKVPNV